MIISGAMQIVGYMKHGAPPSVPTTPTNLVATAQTYTTANVTFTTGYDGGATASYTVVSSPGNITANSSSNVIGLTGLTSGTTYTFTAYATNIVGNSANSANSNQITMPTLVNATGGTTYTGGPYRYHVFNTSANLTVISGGQITVMMVGGGGGGGCSNGSCGGAGGGGAGGVIYAPAVCITAQPYVMTVGAGGSRKGANTIAFCMTALGGGAGIPNYGQIANMGNGGSGGGAAKSDGCIRTYGVSYQTSYAPPGALVYGNNGGATVSNPTAGAGGGGAGTVGGNASGSGACAGGQGGDGTSTYSTFLLAANSGINVSGTYYIAGGGGGGNGVCVGNGQNRRGGYGGGGAGGAHYNPSSAHSGRGVTGNVNTGGGGGGASRDPSTSYNCGGSGGSGVVIIKYQYQ